ncbi:unnamed protein product [Prunus armeniaca]|uniref:Uncharacterized protein n=1 Tax=Prunus armeniaca TaxID=36596 RepID=A0A6J5UJN0_PRUAR|nr:unnamed protein product [Prunus armeniaca]
MSSAYKWAVERGRKALQYGKYQLMFDDLRRNPKQVEQVKSRMKEIEKLFYHDKEPIFCETVSAVVGAKYLQGKHGWRGKTITYSSQNADKEGIIKQAKELELKPVAKDLKGDDDKSAAGPSGSQRDGK